MTDLDYFMIPKDIAPEVASCYQTQQTSDPSMNQSPGISQGTGATFEGGTKRSGRKPAYHLVPIELMEAVARTREEGDRKYAPGNWMKGNKEFFVDCLGHAIEHIIPIGTLTALRVGRGGRLMDTPGARADEHSLLRSWRSIYSPRM